MNIIDTLKYNCNDTKVLKTETVKELEKCSIFNFYRLNQRFLQD